MANYSIFIGRFQPPHNGHLNTLKYINDQAAKDKSTCYVGLTHTNDNKDNPLKFKDKFKFVSLMAKPYKNVTIYPKPVYTIYEFIRDVAFECEKNGGGIVKFYAGSDRVPSYQKLTSQMLAKYQSRNELTGVAIEVVEAAVRNSASTYSATQMRKHVVENDLKSFLAHCPFPTKQENEKFGLEMFEAVKAGLLKDTVTQHNVSSVSDTFAVVKSMAEKISQHTNQLTNEPDKLYIVGGACRDQLLGKKVNDFDLITTMDYREFASMFDADDVRFRGKNIIVVPVINGEPFETACLTRTMSLEDRLRASDLTINAIAQDVSTGEYIDPCHGKEDLGKKIINLTDFMKQAMAQGKQPVAVWRCIRFASVLGWPMTNDTVDTLKKFSAKTKGKLAVSDAQFSKDWGKIQKAGPKAVEEAKRILKEVGLFDKLNVQFPTSGLGESQVNVFISFSEYLKG